MSFQLRSVTIKRRVSTPDTYGGETVTYADTAPTQANVACTRHYRSPSGAFQFAEAGPGWRQRQVAIYFFETTPLPTIPQAGRIVDSDGTFNILFARLYEGQVQVDVELVQ